MLSLALAALVFSAAPTGLASAPFAQLPTHGAAVSIDWRWPDQQLFLDTLQKPLSPARMATGRLRRVDREKIGARLLKQIDAGADPAKAALKLLGGAEESAGNLIWSAHEVMFETGADTQWIGAAPTRVVTTDAASLLVWDDTVLLLDAPPAPLPDGSVPAAQIDWTYTTTLLVAEDSPYAPDRGLRRTDSVNDARWQALNTAMAEDPAKAIALLADFDLTGFRDSDHRLGQIARFLSDHGQIAPAIQIYSRFQPIGRCSMDRAPAHTARAYAGLCYGAGRIGCFLQLQVRIMGDRFERMVWSSYGERAASTESRALVEAGVDARRFLRGLLFKYDAELRPREEMGLWRLARSMHESGIDFADDLQALATHPQLDPVNRHRATQALWLLWRRAQDLEEGTVAARFSALDLLPVSAQWVADVQAAQSANARRDTLRINAR